MLRSIFHWLAYSLGLDPRGLFAFYDGRRWRFADPMVIARELWSIPEFDSSKSRELIASGIGKLTTQGYEEIATAVRQAFNISTVELRGLTEVECDNLLARFEVYLGDLKKNGSPLQTLVQSMAPAVSLPASPTNAASVSG